MLTKLAEETWFYILEHDDETDDYILDVCCGTVAVYAIRFKLNDEERAEYFKDASSITTLANRVNCYPTDYFDRRID
ncbi:MAG TPA: hypothetical protein PKA82_15400 [Pyrinomonadaceae bacterium]|nr:hypothetical protein [Pyrinomonadaceae bacterium]